MELMHTPPDNVVCLAATLSDLNTPGDIVEDDQMESTLMKWTKRISLLIHQ
jgi:hypothetical protein